MNPNDACLVCRFAVFSIVPPGWQPDPDKYAEKTFNSRYQAIMWIRQTERHMKLRCGFYPVAVEVMSNHVCGQFQRDPDDICAGQPPSLAEVVHGSPAWLHARELEQRLALTKHDLRTVREKSTKRMTRIKLLEAKIRVLEGASKAPPLLLGHATNGPVAAPDAPNEAVQTPASE